MSARALDWTYQESVPEEDDDVETPLIFRKMIGAALLYYNLVREVEPIGEHLSVTIANVNRVGDKGITASLLKKYDTHVHEKDFPPADPKTVKELIGDGHEKVKVRCTAREADRDASKAKHGWFMLVHPPTLRVLSMQPQVVHENNEVVTKSLKRVLPTYENCDGFMLDRQCKYAPKAAENPALEQIEYYGVDPFHAKGHNEKCKYCGKKQQTHQTEVPRCERECMRKRLLMVPKLREDPRQRRPPDASLLCALVVQNAQQADGE